MEFISGPGKSTRAGQLKEVSIDDMLREIFPLVFRTPQEWENVKQRLLRAGCSPADVEQGLQGLKRIAKRQSEEMEATRRFLTGMGFR